MLVCSASCITEKMWCNILQISSCIIYYYKSNFDKLKQLLQFLDLQYCRQTLIFVKGNIAVKIDYLLLFDATYHMYKIIYYIVLLFISCAFGSKSTQVEHITLHFNIMLTYNINFLYI